jgi:hypothetical protein
MSMKEDIPIWHKSLADRQPMKLDVSEDGKTIAVQDSQGKPISVAVPLGARLDISVIGSGLVYRHRRTAQGNSIFAGEEA